MFVCPECGAALPVQGHCPADGTLLAAVGEEVLLGQTIGAYRVARLLGIGGMGRVYKGVHPQIGSRVAIKVLSRECSDRRDLVERFFSEAKAVNLIRHESIVNVLDLSTLPDGRPYIVMEYLDGSPLATIVETAQHQRTFLPLGGLARLAAEVLDALSAAHAKGIVHRDLKPDNIYVTPAGRGKVLDFGIAKLQPELGGSATHTGSLLGTPHYMAPEQAAGRPVDHRADIYAMGVILFECATLHKPFVADSLFELLRKHVEAPPPSPRGLRPDMPPELEQVIYTALAKHPDQRFPSAQAMSLALQHATSRLAPDQWTPITPSQRTTTGQSWAAPPPASWAGAQRATVPNQGATIPNHPATIPNQGATIPNHGTIPNQGATIPNQQATQTAGQVTAPATRGSRRGVFIALAAILLVGGGVTAAVLAGGGAAGPGAGSATTVVQATEPATAPAAASAPPPGAPAAPTPAASPPSEGDDGDDLADVGEQLDEVLAMLPAEQKKLLPPELLAALKKYGSFAKIPVAERAKYATQLAGGLGKVAAAAGGDATAALAASPPPAPDSPLGADGWLKYTKIPGPGPFDPKHLDAAAYLAFAVKEARRVIPDAELFRIDAFGVFPDGHADLTIVDNGMLDYRFLSASRAKRDPSLPVGAKQEQKCSFHVMVMKDGVSLIPMNGWDCKDHPLRAPRCSLAQVWQKALAKHAPTNAVAYLGYRDNGSGVATWYFNITDSDHPFSEMFKDDC